MASEQTFAAFAFTHASTSDTVAAHPLFVNCEMQTDCELEKLTSIPPSHASSQLYPPVTAAAQSQNVACSVDVSDPTVFDPVTPDVAVPPPDLHVGGPASGTVGTHWTLMLQLSPAPHSAG